MLKMWLYVICILGPILAVINLLSSPSDETEWVEYNHVDAQPNAQRQPMPEYDDPFLRADHPFWHGNPPAEVIAGEHEWDPPRLQDLPPVKRVPRRTQVKAESDMKIGAEGARQTLLPVFESFG